MFQRSVAYSVAPTVRDPFSESWLRWMHSDVSWKKTAADKAFELFYPMKLMCEKLIFLSRVNNAF